MSEGEKYSVSIKSVPSGFSVKEASEDCRRPGGIGKDDSCELSLVFEPQAETEVESNATIELSYRLGPEDDPIVPPKTIRISLSGEINRLDQQTVEDELIDLAGGNPSQEATAGTIAEACTAEDLSGPLARDCEELLTALAGASADTELEAGLRDALREITPERAAQANASIRQINSAESFNIAGRLSALRAGAAGFSASGLVADIGGYNASVGELGDLLASSLGGLGGAASGDDAEQPFWSDSPWSAFISGQLSKADRDQTDAQSGFSFDTRVVTAGLDYRFNERFVLGAAVSYNEGEQRLSGGQGSLDAEGTTLALYGTYYSSNFFIDAAITRGDVDYDQSRQLEFTLAGLGTSKQIFSADFGGTSTGFNLAAGGNFNFGAWDLGVQTRLDMLQSELDSFTELASDPASLGAGWAVTLDEQEQEWITATLRGTVSYALSQSWGVFVPYVEVDLLHEFGNDAQVITGRFAAASQSSNRLQVVTESPDRNYLRLRVGGALQLPGDFSAFADYGRAYALDNWSEYTVSVGIRYRW